MTSREEFRRWFNRDFWRAFKDIAFPLEVPNTKSSKEALVDTVYDSIASARYSPSLPEGELYIDKGNGVTRTVPVFCIQDYCVYYFCIKELEEVLCRKRTPNTFGGWSLGGSSRKQENTEIESELADYGRYSFNPMAWRKQYGEFNAILFSQLDAGKYRYVLQFDLSNFYDSVRLDVLERWIREEANPQKSWIVSLLFYLLNQWNRRNTGLHPQVVGLPQDALADCSRILANFYLQKYDEFAYQVCCSKDSVYLRYADDQVILTNDKRNVETLLLLLTRDLNRYGLRVNQKKVEIRTATKFERHRCRQIHQIFQLQTDNKEPSLVKKFAGHYLKMSKTALRATHNGGVQLLNRLLWAKIESLPQLTLEKLIRRYLADEYLRRADHGKLERLAKLCKPQLLELRLTRLIESSVHNALHHEVRMFATRKKWQNLEEKCTRRLTEIDGLLRDADNTNATHQ